MKDRGVVLTGMEVLPTLLKGMMTTNASLRRLARVALTAFALVPLERISTLLMKGVWLILVEAPLVSSLPRKTRRVPTTRRTTPDMSPNGRVVEETSS